MEQWSFSPSADPRVKELEKKKYTSWNRAIESADAVQYLELSGSLMDNIGPIDVSNRISEMKNLEVLEVSHYNSITLPSTIQALKKLHTVILQGNEFAPDGLVLGAPLHLIEGLYSLYVSGFYDVKITDDFAKLKKIKRLSIDDCRIDGLHHICRLSSLEELELYCDFQDKNEDYSALQRLTNLHRLRILTKGSVPDSLRLLPLTHLALSASQLTRLPDWLGLLPDLEHLDISYSKVDSLPQGFKTLKYLKIHLSPLASKIEEIRKQLPHTTIYT